MQFSSALGAQQGTDLSEAILDVAASAIAAIDLEDHVVRWNRAAAALTGVSDDQIREQVFSDNVLFPGDKDRWKREFDRICAGSAPRHFDIRWKTHDGIVLSLTCSFSAIRDSAGRVEYLVCTVVGKAGQTDSASLFREFMTDRTTELRDISRFLHDTISQDLVALSFDLSKPSQILARSTLELIDRCCRDIRVISYMLAPGLLFETTLEASIERYAGYVREETGLEIAVDIDPLPETVSPEAQLLFLAAIQKWAACGIRSHPRAELSIRLGNWGAGTLLELEMVLVASAHPASDGWAIVRERALALGGEFELGGDSNRAFVRLSLPDRADHEHG